MNNSELLTQLVNREIAYAVVYILLFVVSFLTFMYFLSEFMRHQKAVEEIEMKGISTKAEYLCYIRKGSYFGWLSILFIILTAIFLYLVCFDAIPTLVAPELTVLEKLLA